VPVAAGLWKLLLVRPGQRGQPAGAGRSATVRSTPHAQTGQQCLQQAGQYQVLVEEAARPVGRAAATGYDLTLSSDEFCALEDGPSALNVTTTSASLSVTPGLHYWKVTAHLPTSGPMSTRPAARYSSPTEPAIGCGKGAACGLSDRGQLPGCDCRKSGRSGDIRAAGPP